MSFIFGAEGLPQTPKELARMRSIANALRKRRTPKNVGEGLTALGEGIASGLYMRQANNAEKAGREGASNAFNSIMSAFGAGGGDTASVPSGGGVSFSGEIPAADLETDPVNRRINQGFAAFGGDGGSNYADAIASIESAGSGDYAAVGPETGKGRAYGRYQVMGFNVGPWTEQHYGKRLSPEEFLASPEAQDAVFNGEFGSYVQKYGNPQDAASMWFTGKPAAEGADRADVNGMTGSGYVDKFNKALGTQTASLNPALAPQQPAIDPKGVLAQRLTQMQGGQVSANPIAEQPEQVAQVQPRPGNVQQPSPGARRVAQAQQGMDQQTQQLIGLVNNPWLDPGQKAVAQAMLQQRMQANDPLRQMQLEKGQIELNRLKNPLAPESFRALQARAQAAGLAPGSEEYEKFMTSGGKGPLVTVNNGEGDKFYENLDKKNAETFATLSDGGVTARGKLDQVDRLEVLLAASPQGMEAGVKQMLGDFGIQTEGLDSIQATRALLEKMVPQQRPAGSGPMSDADIQMFRNSLPRLINQPGGNTLILQTMRGVAQYEVQMGEIADAVADRAITPAEGRKRIRELENPISAFRKTMNGGERSESGNPQQVDPSNALNAARAAIEAGAPREAVINRLREAGIDPSGL